MIVFTKCYPKDSRHDTGSNKQLLPSLINLNVFSSGQTLYLENCSSINCQAWPGIVLAEEKFSQKFKISCETMGRVAAGLCIRNFNIKEWEQPAFLFVQGRLFKYCDSGWRWGRYWPLSISREIFCSIGYHGGWWWLVGRSVVTGEQDVWLAASVTCQPGTCQTTFYPSLGYGLDLQTSQAGN